VTDYDHIRIRLDVGGWRYSASRLVPNDLGPEWRDLIVRNMLRNMERAVERRLATDDDNLLAPARGALPPPETDPA
jgi:hypothetical protein